MFFWFSPVWDKNTDYRYSAGKNHKKYKSNETFLNSDEYLVYGESVWGESFYSEFDAVSARKFIEPQPKFQPRIIEKPLIDFRENNLLEVENANTSSEKKDNSKIYLPPGLRLFSAAKFFYSPKTIKEVFNQAIADWHKEYFEALSKNQTDRLFWINVRNTYSFLAAMIQKSPIGDLVEFINKLRK